MAQPEQPCPAHPGLGAACGRRGLGTDVEMGFPVWQSGHLVSPFPWSWRSARCILIVPHLTKLILKVPSEYKFAVGWVLKYLQHAPIWGRQAIQIPLHMLPCAPQESCANVGQKVALMEVEVPDSLVNQSSNPQDIVSFHSWQGMRIGD